MVVSWIWGLFAVMDMVNATLDVNLIGKHSEVLHGRDVIFHVGLESPNWDHLRSDCFHSFLEHSTDIQEVLKTDPDFSSSLIVCYGVCDPVSLEDHPELGWIAPENDIWSSFTLRLDSRVYFLRPTKNDRGVEVHEIYQIGEVNITRQVETWFNGTLVNNPEFIWNRRKDLQGVRFTTGLLEYKPYTFIPKNNWSGAYGFDIEVESHFQKLMNFSVERISPANPVYGEYHPSNDSWVGLVGLLQRNEINFRCFVTIFSRWLCSLNLVVQTAPFFISVLPC